MPSLIKRPERVLTVANDDVIEQWIAPKGRKIRG